MRTLRFAAWPASLVLVCALSVSTARAECGGIYPANELNWTCDELDRAGCCLDNTLVWCADSTADTVCGLDCAVNGVAPWDVCGWDDEAAWYNCGGSGADPSGDNPLACDWECTPACAGLNCGPDGCGGTCGACGAGQFCHGGVCGPPASCGAAALFSCTDGGMVIEGNTAADGFPLMNEYPGCSGRWVEDGQELAYAFQAPADMTIAFALTPVDPDGTGPALAPDLDLFLLADSCDQLSCVARGDDAYVLEGDSDVLVFNVTAGTTYYVVVDGYDGDAGAFELRLECCAEGYYEPDCTGRSCGPAPGICPGYTCEPGCPICVDGVCEVDQCCGIPEEGCCDGDTVRRCVNNRVVVEDCMATGAGDCGWWDGDGYEFDPGYYCGGEGEGGGLPQACDYNPECNSDCEPTWACGQSQTGEPCGYCDDGEVCEDHACVADETCEAQAEILTCESEIISFMGDTREGVFSIEGYGGTCPSWTESGPELVYAIEATSSGIYTVEIMPVGGDLDVFVLAETCHGDFCLSFGDTSASWNAVEGTTYYILVDGYSGTQTSFSATLDCGACRPDCYGVTCGDDGCGGFCGSCTGDDVCFEGDCCTPDCDGIECGDDGCGGSCGGCDDGAGETCFRGECVVYADYCENLLGFAGCCDDNVNVWCQDGLILQRDCDEYGGVCGWDAELNSYVCGGSGIDPSWEHNMACPWNRPTCDEPSDCDDGDPNTAELCVDGVCDWRICQCAVAGDCDDADEYTIEECVGCLCEYTVNRPCEAGCDDGDPHTIDTCNTDEGVCHHEIDPDICLEDHECFDADPCTDDYCCLGEVGDPAECVQQGIAALHCLSIPSEDFDVCCHGDTDPKCDDEDVCTTDLCRLAEEGPRCTNIQLVGCCRDDSDPDVNDFDACTEDYCCAGAGDPIAACTAAGEIQHVQLTIGPASEGGECCTISTQCDDGDACTLDYCDTSIHACANEPVEDTFPTDPDTGEPLYQCCDPNNPERQCEPDGSSCTDDLCLNYRCFYPRTSPDCCEDGDDQWCADSDPAWDPCTVYSCCTEDDTRPECADTSVNRCGERPYDEAIDMDGECCHNDAECENNDCCTQDLCCMPDDERPECFNQKEYRCLHLDLTIIQECCCIDGDTRCDDGNACTNDFCNTGTELCGHEPIAGCCMGGEPDMAADDECCTIDWCDCGGEPCAEGESGLVRHTEVDCDDDNACTEDECRCADNEDGYECVSTSICADNETCDPEVGCVCAPDCTDAACGDDDGCGNQCVGTCEPGYECNETTFACELLPVEPEPEPREDVPDVVDTVDIVDDKPEVEDTGGTGQPELIQVDETAQPGDDVVEEDGGKGKGSCASAPNEGGSATPLVLFGLLVFSLAVLRRRVRDRAL